MTQDRRLKSYVEQNPFKSARQLKNEVAGWGDVSVRTIQDPAKEAGPALP
jgi:hypothetical protein